MPAVLKEATCCWSAELLAQELARRNRCVVPRAEDTASRLLQAENATLWMTAGVTPLDSLQETDLLGMLHSLVAKQ